MDKTSGTPASPASDLVAVLRTTEPGLLPLAEIALAQAGIEYAIQHSGLSDQIVGRRLTTSEGAADTPIEVWVRAEDASRARDLVRDLESGVPAAPPAETLPADVPEAPAPPLSDDTVDLFDAETGRSLGRITGNQFETLAQNLEMESEDDTDYYIDEPTLAMLEDAKADTTAIALLRRALAGRPGMDVRWARSR